MGSLEYSKTGLIAIFEGSGLLFLELNIVQNDRLRHLLVAFSIGKWATS